MIWKGARLGMGMLGEDGLSRTMRSKFCRTDEIRNRYGGEAALFLM